MVMTVDSLLLATNELRETIPDALITSVEAALDGIVFNTATDTYYKWDMISGCIYSRHKGDWRLKARG